MEVLSYSDFPKYIHDDWFFHIGILPEGVDLNFFRDHPLRLSLLSEKMISHPYFSKFPDFVIKKPRDKIWLLNHIDMEKAFLRAAFYLYGGLFLSITDLRSAKPYIDMVGKEFYSLICKKSSVRGWVEFSSYQELTEAINKSKLECMAAWVASYSPDVRKIATFKFPPGSQPVAFRGNFKLIINALDFVMSNWDFGYDKSSEEEKVS